ncbi:tudor domain-containing protein 10 [Protobothrops mucrosquamatus]|uniref:tudor domain-containing protein 10 n=1 Tax=Protobothrops mucrosquamatus TaxID=103944 RepID=UPI0010FB092C|nr:tudor domain-containing protein 10 [Protobothrops mucrosquamatus]
MVYRSKHGYKKQCSPGSKKLVKANPLKQPGHFKKREVFVGNLPLDISEEEITFLFKDFGIRSLKKHYNSFKSFAFLELMSPEAANLAVQLLNGHPVKGMPMSVALVENKKSHEVPKNSTQMPVNLDSWSSTHITGVTQISLPNQRVCYAVPMEMRSSFLFHMLNDCFGDAMWLPSVAGMAGEVGLMVMDTFPLMPYFWAIILNKECCESMQKLFTALAVAESRLPFLAKEEVQRGTRCLAQCDIGVEGSAWNRCWVLETLGDLAVGFFVDFGRCASLPLTTLRKLDEEQFWEIHPLAQPFVLEEGVFPPQVIRRQILKGKLNGPSQWELDRHNTQPDANQTHSGVM